MTAFVPITPDAAIQIAGGAATPQMLADFAEAGLVKGYARLIQTVTSTDRTEVRDQRIGRDLWRRIIRDGKVAEIWSGGTVRLDDAGLKGGEPAVSLIGIRFDSESIRTVAAQHCTNAGIMPDVSPSSTRSAIRKPATSIDVAAEPVVAAVKGAATPAPDALAAKPLPAGIPNGAIALSINETMDVLGLGRTTVNKLINQGKLIVTKVGGRTLVQVDSIRALLAPTT